MALGVEIAVGAGVQLDDLRADPVRGFDLAGVGRDEDRYAAPSLAQRGDEVGKPVFLTRDL